MSCSCATVCKAYPSRFAAHSSALLLSALDSPEQGCKALWEELLRKFPSKDGSQSIRSKDLGHVLADYSIFLTHKQLSVLFRKFDKASKKRLDYECVC